MSLIGALKCAFKDRHDFHRDERIEAYTLSLGEGERIYRCERCGTVIRTTE